MKTAISAFVFLFVVNAGAAVEMTVQKEAFVIHANSISCMSYQDGSNKQDVAGPYIDIPQIRIANNTDEVFSPALIEVRFKSSMGSYTCTYADYWLDAIGIPVKMGSREMLDLSCPMKCGGLVIGRPEKVTATVELLGYTEDGNGSLKPVKIHKKMDILNP